MPTYDYLCENCEHKFEKFQSMTAPVLRKCPECGKMKLRRLIGTGAGIIFKGSGFYETDYRSESYKQGEKLAQSKTEGKTAGSKPAAKTETVTKSDKPATPKKDAG